jgi:hypothetical protein
MSLNIQAFFIGEHVKKKKNWFFFSHVHSKSTVFSVSDL